MSLLAPGGLADGGQRNLLPALIGVVFALLLWVGAENLRDKLPPLQQQLKTATQMVARGSTDEMETIKGAALDVRAQRRVLESRLQSTESLQMTRARLVFDLRQKCAAAGVRTCAVRVSDELTVAAPTATPRPGAAALASTNAANNANTANIEPTLDALGIGKARAIVTGTFQSGEMLAFYRALMSEPGVQWRVNGVVVRGNTFELDVERHLLLAPAAGGRTG